MRQSGILLHITSLPSAGGIGTLGREAYQFVDFLVSAGMSLWQVLPIGPTGYGESPYQSACACAGNPLLIDLPALVASGELDEYQPVANADEEQVDYERVRAEKSTCLRRAFARAHVRAAQEVSAFTQTHPWVADYALFAAVKEHFNSVKWSQWPDDRIRMRTPEGIAHYRAMLSEEIAYHTFVQMLFFRQWAALKKYANERGVALVGDMPIYAAEDSADTWANSDMFQLDAEKRPIDVAGVPPDYFSADGQKWGNPLYDWKALRRAKYGWWTARMRGAEELFDYVRIDHFIGFANYYCIPAAAPNARTGEWRKGPGMRLFRAIRKAAPNLRIIAEDLGEVGPRVKRLLRRTGFPGMRVLCFAFDGGDNPHLPEKYVKNSVVYTGTHDNDTLRGWWDKAPEESRARARQALGIREEAELTRAGIHAVMASCADRCMLSMQDVLDLDGTARMNLPGTVGGNWQWRMKAGACTEELTAWLNGESMTTGRNKES